MTDIDTAAAEHFRSEWERAIRSGHDKWLPFAEPPQSWPLTDADVPLIGWSVIADHPELGYLADPEASRPATADELAKVEERAHEEYAGFLALPKVLPVPHGPWPTSKAAVTAPEAAAEPEPEPQPEAAEDPAPVLGPIAELAMSRFEEAHDAQDQREATAQIEAVGDATEVTPAITEGGAA